MNPHLRTTCHKAAAPQPLVYVMLSSVHKKVLDKVDISTPFNAKKKKENPDKIGENSLAVTL